MSWLLRLLGVLIVLVVTALRACWQAVLELLSPPRCCACDGLLRQPATFCPPCAASIAPLPSPRTMPGGPGVQVLAFAEYGGALADAVRRYKDHDRPDLAQPLGELALRATQRRRWPVEIVVPVPLHPTRLADRGYNQAALLAARIASALGAPLAPRALRRCRATRPQRGLNRQQRAENLSGAFAVRQARLVQGREVLLVDDVMTTGATLSACARALYRAGARTVRAVVVASALVKDGPARS